MNYSCSLLRNTLFSIGFLCSGMLYASEMPENVAKGKKATASGNENNIYLPKLAVDGITNRDKGGREQSRWTSNVVPNNQIKNGKWTAPDEKSAIWLMVDLGEVKTNLQDFLIEWEFAKATHYAIEMSQDGTQWKTVWESKKISASPTEYIRLKSAESARFVRLNIRQFERQAWGAISLYEFQVFNGKLPENAETLAARINADMIDVSKDQIAYRFPEGTKGINVKVLGSNYKQIITTEGKIHHPLSDKTVWLTLELSDAQKKAQTNPIPVLVKGIASGNGNPKPAVIPALQEWKGTTGNWTVPNHLELRVMSDDIDSKTDKNTVFIKMMKIFAEDYRLQTNQQMQVVPSSVTQTFSKPTLAVKLLAKNEKLATKLGEEGYSIEITPEQIKIMAGTPRGAFWATRSLLQILKNNQNKSIPCGEICDYPQYPVRGFMFDVGRKPVTIEMIRDVMKMMSWYKMNDLQLHLNDNFIWLHDYTQIPNKGNAKPEEKKTAIQEVMDAAPTAFRLESDMVGANGVKLTTTAHYYTKEQFGQFIDLAEQYGVNIVPEFDVPGHAMSFVKVRPDLMYRGGLHKPHDVERAAMLDASSDVFDPKTGKTYREETLDFAKKVFDEYLTAKDGKPPVFRKGVVHIGTDEYYGNAEDYRWFADALLRYVKSKGFTPRLWGSLTAKKGKTPVVSEGVQMHIWSRDWQRPLPAIEAGYDIINILDADMYIVPNGNGGTGAYNDYISLPNLYGPRWQPHVMQQYKVIPGHPRLLGAQFAVWNDNSWRRDTGLIDYDLYDRIERTACVLAEKTWNNGTDRNFDDFMKLYNQTGTYPSINPRHLIPSKTEVILNMDFSSKEILDLSGNNYSAVEKTNISIDKGREANNPALVMKSNSSIKLPISNLAPDYSVSFWIYRNSSKENQDQILFSSSIGQFKAVQKETGKVGFSRESWDFSFDYTLPVGQWVKMRIDSKGRQLTLFVNDQKIGAPKRHTFPGSHRFSSFIFPLEYIGSSTNSFDGMIDDLSVIKK